MSYLLFGRHTYELASGERQLLAGTAGSFLGAGFSAASTVFSNAVTTRLGAVLAQQWGLDYFAITEVGSVQGLSAVSQTQVELGRYVGQDLFLVLALQPAQVFGGSGSYPSGAGGIHTHGSFTPWYFWEWTASCNRTDRLQTLPSRPQKTRGCGSSGEWGY